MSELFARERNVPRPLDQVLTHARGDFLPARPDRPPWWQPRSVIDEVAYTGNLVTAPLQVADRVHLHRLDRPSYEQDWLEPLDWFPAGWGVGST
jgi:hypothetical protein